MIRLKIHIVQKGDTLWELSKQYGVDFEELKQVNSQLSSPDMIMPGMKIKIPSSTKQVKKEEGQVKKETQKMEMPPKPQIKEDDKEKPKEVQPSMPIQHMPTYPIHPLPTMEQEMHQHMTFNFPEAAKAPAPKEKVQPKKEQPQVKMEEKKAEPYPMQQAPTVHQQMPMMPMCCHMVHPCCTPMHFHQMQMQMPLNQGHHHPMQYCNQPYRNDNEMIRTIPGNPPSSNIYPGLEPARPQQVADQIPVSPMNVNYQAMESEMMPNTNYPLPPSYPPYLHQQNSNPIPPHYQESVNSDQRYYNKSEE